MKSQAKDKMSKHNKKRNVGIIYEQLLSSLSKSLVEGKSGEVKIVKGLIDKHFRPGTELYKEFRLFQAMVKTNVPRESLAIKILEEAKKASNNLDSKKLQIEKSLLIKDINHKIADGNFYNQRVNEYRDFATVQVLLNLWNKGDLSSLKTISEYEAKVQEMLLSESKQAILENEKTSEINSFTVKIMLEKFNKKYDGTLNEVQAKIIKEYVFSPKSDLLTNLLKEVKQDTLKEIANLPEKHSNQILCEKVNNVKGQISSLKESVHDDDNISRFLLLSKLCTELKEESP